ncbi:MAG: FIVAR domain-containing protein [Oscillospiraceae bacterium]|nr:FIVAR domain-containing protein [Oscillospiraceae bacterium]
MSGLKRFFSAVLAGVIAFSAAGATSLPVLAASTDSEKKTYDGVYDLTDTVPYWFFDTDNDYDVNTALEKKLRSALGKTSLDHVTFKDLQKVSTLNLSGMKLTDLPEAINYMENLRTLNLSDNLLQDEAMKVLDLEGCTRLSTIDLSKNYLTKVPSWFVTDRVTNGKISDNFIASDNPRTIKVPDTKYYFSNGDKINVNAFRNKVLNTVRFGDGSMLPDFLYDYANPPYSERYGDDDDDPLYDYQLTINLGDFVKYIKDGEIVFTEADSKVIDATVRLAGSTTATVNIYLMNGVDLSSMKMLLQALLDEYTEKNKSKSSYTTSSWTNYENAYNVANAIIKYPYADAEMYKSAFDTLNHANRNLVFSANGNAQVKQTLADLAKLKSNYKEENYTPSSWAVFKEAMDRIEAIAKDNNASLDDARRAITAFQSALNALVGTSLKVPAKAPKSDFEQIFGLASTKSYEGITRDGRKYTWKFSGKDIITPAEFNPEIKDSDAANDNILLEVGSVTGYFLFATVQTGAFPGKATLTIEKLPDYITNGNYYLYKWDNSAKRSSLAGTATVNNGTASIPLSEGGVYYICRDLNFDLSSSQFKIDAENKKLTIPLSSGYTVKNFRAALDNGNYVEIRDSKGNKVSDSGYIMTGMTVNAPDRDRYSIVVIGDVSGDGKVNVSDATAILRALATGTNIQQQSAVSDINGDGSVNVKDVTALLIYLASH